MPPQFLFVNKDAGSASLTRSNSTEQSSINSHVQRGRKHNRSASSRGRYNRGSRQSSARESFSTMVDSSESDVATISYDFSGLPTNKESSEEYDAIESSLPSRPRSHSQRRRRGQFEKFQPKRTLRKSIDGSRRYELFKDSKKDGKSVVLLNSAHLSNSPRDITQISSTSLDPFSQSVVKLDAHVAKLCWYFCEKYHPSVWSAESRTSPGGSYTYQHSAPAVIRRAMQNEVEMNAILACMAARIENVDSIPGQGTDKYMGNALTAVRRRFSSASRHQLLLIIFHLYAGEAYRQNYTAAKIHMRAAKALFASWGGLDQIPDPCVKELFIIGDGHVSAVLLEPCDLPCEYDPGSYWSVTPPALQLAQAPDLTSIAPALLDRVTAGDFPDDLGQVIQETAECAWVLRHAATGPADATKHAARWLQWRHAAIRHRLLSMKPSNPCHDAVRVALIMWILISMVLLGLQRLGCLIAPKLRAILHRQACALARWGDLVDVRMWVLSVGAMCSSIGGVEEEWFLDQLLATGLAEQIRQFRSKHPNLATIDILRTFQERFFYHDPIQQVRLKRLADLLEDPMDHPTSRTSSPAPERNSSSPI
ncbi:hypothetical protein A1O1_04927 [Capronia coronata CBS 617.96]|uniref:Transcription factor domain-containing protein n=1 Tax=Capronia coronata CBS 617.96 TaxID=1182541 RepID=W9YEB1_9EURO|nr:uncharacterized protein A1O1_04927 [Capronia coronata CBS 617.96]EXJ88000.1 hypothetical protein A1O1_04927 [Capronia coronata CBS 617.96]